MSGSKEQATSMAMSQTMNSALVTPAEIQWGPAPDVLPAGIQGAVLYGDPTKDGLFSMRFKLPKGYRVAPHTLSKAGLFTVISGIFRIGMGEKADPSKARAMPAGSFIALAPSTPHFVAGDEETVVSDVLRTCSSERTAELEKLDSGTWEACAFGCCKLRIEKGVLQTRIH